MIKRTVLDAIVVVASVVILSFAWQMLLEYLKRDNPQLSTSFFVQLAPFFLVVMVYAAVRGRARKEESGQ
jgi:uncharacterized membrane protein